MREEQIDMTHPLVITAVTVSAATNSLMQEVSFNFLHNHQFDTEYKDSTMFHWEKNHVV